MTMINLQTVLNSLHNLMGKRIAPSGTDEDLKRYIQASFDYCWRYYKWDFALKSATVDEGDGLLPEDFDYDGYRSFSDVTEVSLEDSIATGNTGSAISWDSAQSRYVLSPMAGGSLVYQMAPPTLTTDTDVPFPSAQVVALGATIYAKMAENPTRADIQQEWDLFHSELDRLVGRANNNRVRRPTNYHDRAGSYTGYVG